MKAEVEAGMEASTTILMAANAAIDREERNQAMAELNQRVEDWKGHRLESFGDLLLNGTYQVIKGDSSSPKDQEREVFQFMNISRKQADDAKYKIYLFEQILLCCKEMNTNKQKNKVLGKNVLDPKGRPKLQLKGRIFMQNVTDTIVSAKPGIQG
jgi:cell division control protein 24